MTIIALILNLPWTLITLVLGLLSIPTKISFTKKPIAIVIYVKEFWWLTWLPFYKGARAMAMGNVVLMTSHMVKNDLEHELIHVEQFQREPLIHPIFGFIETMRNGYRYNKYEKEAYERAGNIYRGETKSLKLAKSFLGKKVDVVMDRPLGSKHPKHGFIYEANYGYVPDTKAPDGQELDAYYLGLNHPLQKAEGICIAVIHRLNNDDDKLVVVPNGTMLTDREIKNSTHFQEQWFETEIVR